MKFQRIRVDLEVECISDLFMDVVRQRIVSCFHKVQTIVSGWSDPESNRYVFRRTPHCQQRPPVDSSEDHDLLVIKTLCFEHGIINDSRVDAESSGHPISGAVS